MQKELEPSETEKAWAAGFFDGEGSSYLVYSRSGRPYLRLQVVNTEIELLERFQAVCGGRIYVSHRSGESANPHWKRCYKLCVAAKIDVLRAVLILMRYISEPKSRQLNIALMTMDDTLNILAGTPVLGSEEWFKQRDAAGVEA